jgi:glycosyltransferase involved in cell wall biosynthesis
MLERIAETPPPEWRHGERWAERMRRWAQRCARLIVAPAGLPRALRLLDVPRERITTLSNGADTRLFSPLEVDRAALWRRVLVQQPRGWLPGRRPGSARYDEQHVAALGAGAVLLYVGRFTAVKRLDRLIAAFVEARQACSAAASLVIVGGHPGEWEGEHPAEIASRLGADSVFLAGWYGQEELPELLSASDALVMASEREQFGQVLVEAMSCGLPVVAARSLGPELIVDDGRTGWLTEPDDHRALAHAMTEVVERPDERARRGAAARKAARERFSWDSISAQFATVLEEVIGHRPPAATASDADVAQQPRGGVRVGRIEGLDRELGQGDVGGGPERGQRAEEGQLAATVEVEQPERQHDVGRL